MNKTLMGRILFLIVIWIIILREKYIYCNRHYIMSGDMQKLWRDPWGFRDRFFEQIDKEFSEAEDMLNRMFRTERETGTTTSQTSPYFYGYQITIGPEGKPHIREFGNIRPSSKGLIEQSTVRQPLIDTRFNEKENTLVITAEMPGITKEDVKVSME